ncbi:MAG: hypothetical protein C0508_08795 [Cyanobacteria bacterium PR.023]|jgi:hypothetical protein|nr:hypothetical protein [Cyanobacteria bacterium PR.023]
MLNRIVSSIIFATLLALGLAFGFVFVSPAQAQMIEEVQQAEGAPAVVQEHRSRSGWEQPLVEKENNLKHYYWTEIDRNKAAYKVINRAGTGYSVMPRTASDCKPKVLPPRANKNIWGDIHTANSDLSGRIRPAIVAQARPQTAVYSYSGSSYGNTYGKVMPSYGSSPSSSASKNVNGRVMSY